MVRSDFHKAPPYITLSQLRQTISHLTQSWRVGIYAHDHFPPITSLTVCCIYGTRPNYYTVSKTVNVPIQAIGVFEPTNESFNFTNSISLDSNSAFIPLESLYSDGLLLAECSKNILFTHSCGESVHISTDESSTSACYTISFKSPESAYLILVDLVHRLESRGITIFYLKPKLFAENITILMTEYEKLLHYYLNCRAALDVNVVAVKESIEQGKDVTKGLEYRCMALETIISTRQKMQQLRISVFINFALVLFLNRIKGEIDRDVFEYLAGMVDWRVHEDEELHQGSDFGLEWLQLINKRVESDPRLAKLIES